MNSINDNNWQPTTTYQLELQDTYYQANNYDVIDHNYAEINVKDVVENSLFYIKLLVIIADLSTINQIIGKSVALSFCPA